MESDFDRKVSLLLAREPRFPADAYYFISEAVAFTVARLEKHRHVSAAELLDGIRLFAEEKFGAVARSVLSSWGMHKEDEGCVFEYRFGCSSDFKICYCFICSKT